MSKKADLLDARHRKTPPNTTANSTGNTIGAKDPKRPVGRQKPNIAESETGADDSTSTLDSIQEKNSGLRFLFPVPDTLDEYPLPFPPSTRKHEILKGVDFTEIDQRALKIPRDVIQDGRRFTQYFSEHAQDDLHKLRGIFRWLTSQRPWDPFVLDDLHSCDPRSPVGLLAAIRQKKYTFAEVFALLCREADIRCVVISGIAKGARYEVGFKIDPDWTSSKWTAVCLDDDNWRMVHPLWASQVTKGYHEGCWVTVETNMNEDQDRNVIYTSSVPAINEFYFLTDPDRFISKCLAFDEDWQLLHQNLTMEMFEKSLNLQPAFYELGLEVIGWKNCTIHTDNGKIEVKLALPGDSVNILRFTYHLFLLRDAGDEGEYKYILTDSFVFFHYSSDGVVSFDLNFPLPGTFKLELHCQDPGRELKSDWICDFCIVCKSSTIGWEPLPIIPAIGWGPGPEVTDFGLTALTHTKALIVVENEEPVTVKFVISRKIELKLELVTRLLQKSEVEKLVISDTNGKEYRIQISLPPIEGRYALRIFTKDQKRGKNLRNICNYLIVKRKPDIPKHIVTMNKQLHAALRDDNLEVLSSVIDKFTESGIIGNKDLEMAKKKCINLRLRKVLEYAINSRDLEVLERTVTDAYDPSVRGELKELIEETESIRKRLQKLKKFRRAILEMDQKTIAELRSYSRPPPVVHAIMIVTFLLLGYPEKELMKWPKIQSLIAKQGREGIKRKIAAFDCSKVPSVSLKRARELLAQHDDFETFEEPEHGASTFASWARHTVSEMDVSKVLKKPTQSTTSIALKPKVSWKT